MRFAAGKVYLTMEGNLARNAEVSPRRPLLTGILICAMQTVRFLQGRYLAVVGCPQTPLRCLGSLFMALPLEGIELSEQFGSKKKSARGL